MGRDIVPPKHQQKHNKHGLGVLDKSLTATFNEGFLTGGWLPHVSPREAAPGKLVIPKTITSPRREKLPPPKRRLIWPERPARPERRVRKPIVGHGAERPCRPYNDGRFIAISEELLAAPRNEPLRQVAGDGSSLARDVLAVSRDPFSHTGVRLARAEPRRSIHPQSPSPSSPSRSDYELDSSGSSSQSAQVYQQQAVEAALGV